MKFCQRSGWSQLGLRIYGVETPFLVSSPLSNKKQVEYGILKRKVRHLLHSRLNITFERVNLRISLSQDICIKKSLLGHGHSQKQHPNGRLFAIYSVDDYYKSKTLFLLSAFFSFCSYDIVKRPGIGDWTLGVYLVLHWIHWPCHFS